MDLIEWFNVNRKEHLLAYNELQKTGYWPSNFIPYDIELPPHWQFLLSFKISNQYIKEKTIEYSHSKMTKCFKKIVKKSIFVMEDKNNEFSEEYKLGWKSVMEIINKYQ